MKDIQEIAERLFQILSRTYATYPHSVSPSAALTDIALTHLCRAGGPGSALSAPARKKLKGDLVRSAKIFHVAVDNASLKQFATHATLATISRLPKNQRLSRSAKLNSNDETALSHIIAGKIGEGFSPDVAISQALMQLKKMKFSRGATLATSAISLDEGLKSIFAIPDNTNELPLNDIRVFLLRAVSGLTTSKDAQSNLFDLMQQAAPFSEKKMRTALGAHLYAQCRPIGYTDRFNKIILVDVPSSVVASEIGFKKAELIARLQKVEGLSQVNDIRIRINNGMLPQFRV